MTTIKATCPVCGEVALTADDIVLRIAAVSETNSYGFSCPRCTNFIQKPADERIVHLLLTGGVRPVAADVPAEVLEYKPGPPIAHDDLLVFHEGFDRDGWFDELLERRSTSEPPS